MKRLFMVDWGCFMLYSLVIECLIKYLLFYSRNSLRFAYLWTWPLILIITDYEICKNDNIQYICCDINRIDRNREISILNLTMKLNKLKSQLLLFKLKKKKLIKLNL